MVSFKDTIEFTPSDSKADSDGYCHSRGSNFMFKNSLSKLGGGIIMVLILYIAEITLFINVLLNSHYVLLGPHYFATHTTTPPNSTAEYCVPQDMLQEVEVHHLARAAYNDHYLVKHHDRAHHIMS